MDEETVDTSISEQREKSNEQQRREDRTDHKYEREAAPGVPIVRGNTPRPFMYNAMTAIPSSQLPDALPNGTHEAFSTVSAFPTKPPSAPPLPEEPDEYSDEVGENMYTFSTPNKISSPTPGAQEFVWLFEYGLEMDTTFLNTPERLDGLALLYGSAVLKGYRLLLGTYEGEDYRTRTMATIVPDAQPDAEVWGVVYRVPRHAAQQHGDVPALLETVHVVPQSGVQAMHVVAHETYHNRALPCLTYGSLDAASAQKISSTGVQDGLDIYVRRLTSIARKQKLPDAYIKQLVNTRIAMAVPNTPASSNDQRETAPSLPAVVASRTEQHTEPLIVPVEKLGKGNSQVVHADSTTPSLLSQVRRIPIKASSNRWFVAFAIYLFCLLLMVLAFAVVQGTGIANDILNEKFTLLSVPWLVLVYGLLGGCISSIITLGRTSHPVEAPVFVVITWFTRPFVGAVLALFAYLLLSSGLFMPVSNVGSVGGQHEALFLLVGALAGLCEGWLFLPKR